MKVMVELRNEPMKGDILLHDGKEWNAVPKIAFLKETDAKIDALNAKIDTLSAKIDEITEKINEKLKAYHEILAELTKEE